MKRHITPPSKKITEFDISKAVEYALNIQQYYPDKFEYARQILLTHLPLHENINETVQSIIAEYSLDYDTRMLFIGVAQILKISEKDN